jgi:hypothetical protein
LLRSAGPALPLLLYADMEDAIRKNGTGDEQSRLGGPLSDGSVTGALRDAYGRRETGLLHFDSHGTRLSVRFVSGHIVSGASSAPHGRLGPCMVRHGLLSAADLDRAAGATAQGKRLGVVLQELGVLEKQKLEEAVGIHVREVLAQALSWTDGTYSFEPQVEEIAPREDVTLRLSTGDLLLEVVRGLDPKVARCRLGSLDQVVVPSSDPLLRFQRVTLSSLDGFVLSRADGTMAASAILDIAPLTREEAEKSLLGLLCTGMLERVPAELVARPVTAGGFRAEIIDTFQRLPFRNHFEVLGVSPSSSDAEVKAAYHQLVKRFHPDVHHDPTLADLKHKLQAIFVRLGLAYKALVDAPSRGRYAASFTCAVRPVPKVATPEQVDRTEPAAAPAAAAAAPSEATPALSAPVAARVETRAVLPEESLRNAQQYFEHGHYWDAIQTIEEVLPAMQGRLRARARLLLAQAYLKNPKWTKSAEQELKNVLADDPSNADAYFLLGTIYKQGGLAQRSTNMFRKALELNPRHKGASAEVVAPPPPTRSRNPLDRLLARA